MGALGVFVLEGAAGAAGLSSELLTPSMQTMTVGTTVPLVAGKHMESPLCSVCPSRWGCGAPLTGSTSRRLPKAEALMSPTL